MAGDLATSLNAAAQVYKENGRRNPPEDEDKRFIFGNGVYNLQKKICPTDI